MEKKRYPLRMKLSLLSISLVLTSATAISASIPDLAAAFPNKSISSIELLSTVPAMMVVVFVIFSNIIAGVLGKKKTVLMGLLIAAISGIIPVFSNHYGLIFLSRMGLGVGFGLFNGFAVSLIIDFFTGKERSTMIGFQGAFQGLGSSLMTLCSGLLLQINWHFAFAVYFIITPILLSFLANVPEPDHHFDETVKEDEVNGLFEGFRNALNPQVVKIVSVLFLVMIIYMTVALKISGLLLARDIGTTAEASIMLTVLQLGTMFAGFIYGWIEQWFKGNTYLLALLTMAASLLLIAYSHNLILLNIASFLVGASMSTIISYFFSITSHILPPQLASVGTSLVIVGANLGNFISPIGIHLISLLSFGMLDQIASPFVMGASLLMVLAALKKWLVPKWH